MSGESFSLIKISLLFVVLCSGMNDEAYANNLQVVNTCKLQIVFKLYGLIVLVELKDLTC